MNRKSLLHTAILCFSLAVLIVVAGFYMGGCSLLKTAQSAPVNQTVTEVIADAGAAARAAEQAYQAGTIPQTAAARNAINDLGNAYNDARSAYTAVLIAETTYNAAVNTQLAACAPASTGTVPTPSTGSASTCPTATAHATAQKTALDNANAALSGKVSVLTAKISAVKQLSASK